VHRSGDGITKAKPFLCGLDAERSAPACLFAPARVRTRHRRDIGGQDRGKWPVGSIFTRPQSSSPSVCSEMVGHAMGVHPSRSLKEVGRKQRVCV